MKNFLFTLLFTGLILSCAKTQPTAQPTSPAAETPSNSTAAELSFSYTRLGGVASNQFAVWVEDSKGGFVKTLFVTKWTANGGWKRRPSSIPMWVQKADAASLSQSQIDAVSGATPRTGELVFTWDGTNSRGEAVSDGDYVIILEGTLRWENQVYCRAPIRLGNGTASSQVTVEYIGDAGKDREMIENVKVKVLR